MMGRGQEMRELGPRGAQTELGPLGHVGLPRERAVAQESGQIIAWLQIRTDT